MHDAWHCSQNHGLQVTESLILSDPCSIPLSVTLSKVLFLLNYHEMEGVTAVTFIY
jgi:hypothetical protein